MLLAGVIPYMENLNLDNNKCLYGVSCVRQLYANLKTIYTL